MSLLLRKLSLFSYPNKTNDEIIAWLKERKNKYDIVYISGDTDSFAGPDHRIEQAIQLVERIAKLGVDIMITTRAIIKFNGSDHLDRLTAVTDELRKQGLHFFACVSITHYSHPELEPSPIPTVAERIAQLKRFKEAKMVSVLAMRPFLPVVGLDEYQNILDDCKDHIDLVLGKEWYADEKMIKDVNGESFANSSQDFSHGRMAFDINEAQWSVYNPIDKESAVRDMCYQLGLPFFMKSRPATDWITSARRRAPRVVGMGALNVNFLAWQNFIAEYIPGDEVLVSDDTRSLWDRIKERTGRKFGTSFESVFLGGGAYHAIDCLRHLHDSKNLELEYVGIAGRRLEDVTFNEETHRYDDFDILDELRKRQIGSKYVRSSKRLPGLTVNTRSGDRRRLESAIRNNVTEPNANDEFALLIGRLIEQDDPELLVKHLASADWIHVSSLADHNAMLTIAKLISAAKKANLSLRVSWDTGELRRKEGGLGAAFLARKPIVSELLRATDFVILKRADLLALANVSTDKSELEAAREVFRLYAPSAKLTLVVQSTKYQQVDFFWSHWEDVIQLPVRNPKLFIRGGKVDVTAASACLSAAIIDSQLRPDLGFDMSQATKYGMELVWKKLICNPKVFGTEFGKVRKTFISQLRSMVAKPKRHFLDSAKIRIAKLLSAIIPGLGKGIMHNVVAAPIVLICGAILLFLGRQFSWIKWVIDKIYGLPNP